MYTFCFYRARSKLREDVVELRNVTAEARGRLKLYETINGPLLARLAQEVKSITSRIWRQLLAAYELLKCAEEFSVTATWHTIPASYPRLDPYRVPTKERYESEMNCLDSFAQFESAKWFETLNGTLRPSKDRTNVFEEASAFMDKIRSIQLRLWAIISGGKGVNQKLKPSPRACLIRRGICSLLLTPMEIVNSMFCVYILSTKEFQAHFAYSKNSGKLQQLFTELVQIPILRILFGSLRYVKLMPSGFLAVWRRLMMDSVFFQTSLFSRALQCDGWLATVSDAPLPLHFIGGASVAHHDKPSVADSVVLTTVALSDLRPALGQRRWFKVKVPCIRNEKAYRRLRFNYMSILIFRTSVDSEVWKARRMLAVGVVILTLVLLVSPIFIMLLRHTVVAIQRFTVSLESSTQKLMNEKQKSDLLLSRMLPMPVIRRLRAQRAVPAEAFDAVTIFFSDIVGFTTICATSSPMEVINMLNMLYK
ncbi:Receptor-type guanylate cyclase gcy-13 [Eumeta japonica]|uniref:Receptor-type guanylate cyclase gcy-13 n=1 Tax=Eumeta variegata TaxID=151549 RepID=A0A4C1STA1_EUMVA|nr:Receptor-type guanylate cyclase gcy-13 [Eumeta japonica]